MLEDENLTESPSVEDTEGVTDSTPMEAASSPDAEDVNASPSDAQETEDSSDAPKDMLDAVRKAVDINEAKADKLAKERSDESDEAEDDAESKDDAEEVKAEDDTEDESQDEKLPFGKHPRFKKLVSQRNELRSEVERLKPLVEDYQQVQDYMKQNDLAPQEVAQAMQILTLLKTDPLKAKEALQPTLQLFASLSGEALPDDIKQKVEEGYMDEDTAKEVAALRAQSAVQKQRAQEFATQQQQRQQEQYAQQSSQQLYNAVSNWEQTIAARDPDYAKLKPLVMKATQAALAQGRPSTPEQAIALVESAYREVQDSVKALMPKRTAQRTVTSTNSVSTSASPKPSSLLEAVTQAANQSS